jgi:hypothetical protein
VFLDAFQCFPDALLLMHPGYLQPRSTNTQQA